MPKVATFGVEYERIYNEAEEEYECFYNGTDHGLGGNIVADAEGLSLYVDEDGGGYYVLSSQGSNRFNVYSRKTFVFVGSFSVFLGDDMVSNTDGVEIASGYFGDGYAEGVMVVQDEGNDDVTNFKIVSFDDVLNGIYECDLDVNTTMFYSTMSQSKDEGKDVQDEKINLILMGVFAGLLLMAFGLCLFYKFYDYAKAAKQPNNYVELQNK